MEEQVAWSLAPHSEDVELIQALCSLPGSPVYSSMNGVRTVVRKRSSLLSVVDSPVFIHYPGWVHRGGMCWKP